MARPIRIEEVRAGEHAQVGASRRDDRVHVHVGRDVSHRHRRHADLMADSIGERRLEQPAVYRPLIGYRLSRRNVDDVAAVCLQHSRDRDGIVRLHSAWHPVDRADADAHRLLVGPHRAARVEDFEREPHAIVERAAVLVGARVRERRDERREQISVRHVDFEQIEARIARETGGVGEGGDGAVHVGARHLARHGAAVRKVRNRRRGDKRPSTFRQRLVVAFP